MNNQGIYSINYWEQFVPGKFRVNEGDEPFGIVVPDSILQKVGEHPYLNDPKRRFCTYAGSEEELFLTAHGVIAVTRRPRHRNEMLPSIRIFSPQKHNLVSLAVDAGLPFDKEKIVLPENYWG